MILLYILLTLAGVALLLLLAALIKTLLTPARRSGYVPQADSQRAALYSSKLSRMVQIPTVSQKGLAQRDAFLPFHALLEELFPLVHQQLEKTEIDGSLLFFWQGQSHKKPLVLMAHQDVVPAEGAWQHPHFSGHIDEQGRIWGRGSADDKSSLMAIFQGVEELLAEGFVPPQDVYISSSNSEEVAGDGCAKLVQELARRGVKPFLVNDEGGAITTRPMAGIEGNFAMIGILEKGQGNLKIMARSQGGHSSYPAKNSPIPRLARFVCQVEKRNPMRSLFTPQLKNMLQRLSPYGPFYLRLLLGNLWLFAPLLKKLMPSISPQAGALLRTTTAFTMQKGSDGYNVMPQEASLILNLRYMPHQNRQESNELIRKLAARYDLEVEEVDGYDACRPVSTESEAFHLVERVIQEVFPSLPQVPYIMTGGTDARFYESMCDACIRFAPIVYGPEQMKGMHGLDEYVDGNCLPGAVDYYKTLIRFNH